MLPFSAHQLLECCSIGTSLLISISNNTITLYGRELSLNIRGKQYRNWYIQYLSKLCILHFGVAWTIAAQSINIASIRWGMSWDDHMHHHLNWQPRWISVLLMSVLKRFVYIFLYFKSLLAELSWTWQAMSIFISSYNSLGHCLAGNVYHLGIGVVIKYVSEYLTLAV